jgi:hypothetical protein
VTEPFSFIRFLRDRGDWSAAQRAKLERLADSLEQAGLKVEVVFGKGDAGDPWCVVKGEDEEVLVHVARIGGKFVIHSFREDTIEETADLETVLGAWLSTGGYEGPEREGDVVLPFEMRRAHTLMALAASADVFESAAPSDATAASRQPGADPIEAPETTPPAPHPDSPPPATRHPPANPVQGEPPPAGPAGALDHEPPPPDRAEIAPGPIAIAPDHAVESEGDLARGSRPLQTLIPMPTARAALDMHGTPGSDSLVGSAHADLITGGAGNDTLVGGGGADTLEGGDGDDRLEFSDGALVIGGRGADTFVVDAPTHAGPNQLLGVILDFSSAEGDRVITSRGRLLKFKSQASGETSTPATASGEHHANPHDDGAQRTVTRVDVDIDDDGAPDGYLLVVTRSGAPDDSSAATPGVQVLGLDPHAPTELLLDVTGDGLVDGRLVIDPDNGPALLVVSRSLFPADPFAAT